MTPLKCLVASRISLAAALTGLAFLTGIHGVSAAEIIKAANTDALNLNTSWQGGAAPSAADSAVWDSTTGNPGGLTAVIGGNNSWLGLAVRNVGATVNVNHTAGVSLTLGGGGIDNSAAGQNLTLDCNLVLGTDQTWSLADTKTINLHNINGGRTLTGSASLTLARSGASGTATFSFQPGASGSVGYNDAGSFNTFSGNWVINPGALVRNIRNGRTAWGTGGITLAGGTVGPWQGNWAWTTPITLQTGTSSTIDNRNTSGSNRYLKQQGVISGDGNLTFADTGSGMGNLDLGFILTGNNTLSGGLTITSTAELRVGGVPGDDGTTGAGAGGSLGTASVTNNGTLTFARLDTHTVANAITGTGALRIGGAVSGAGVQVVNYTGAATHTGATTVGSGRLNVNGSLGNSVVTVNSGAILGGTGSVAGNTTVNGRLDPGTATNSTALLAFGGSLTFGAAASGTFEVNGTARGSTYDAVNVTGTAILDGTITVSGSHTYAAGDAFQLFSAGSINAAAFNVATDLVLPTLLGGLFWDTSTFITDGTIRVANVPDMTPPTVAARSVSVFASRLRLRFSEPVTTNTATALTNYVVQGGALDLASAVMVDLSTVDIFTLFPPTPGASYTLEISNVQDYSGNPIAPATLATFTVVAGIPVTEQLVAAFDGSLTETHAVDGVEWPDRSGNENHARSYSAAAGTRPTLVAASLNGRNTLNFLRSAVQALRIDGAASTGLGGDAMTWFAVSKPTNFAGGVFSSVVRHQSSTDNANWGSYFFPGNAGTGNQPGLVSNGRNTGGGEVAAIAFPAAPAAWTLASGYANGPGSEIFGRLETPSLFTASSATNSGTALRFGTPVFTYLGTVAGALASGAFDGEIAEMLVYAGALDAAQRDEVEAYLRVKYFPPIAPSVTTQPASQTAECAGSATFTVSATGTPPLAYQWYFNSNTIGGATSPTLALNPVSFANGGAYHVVVTNDGGSATSSVATLTITDTTAPTLALVGTNPLTLECPAAYVEPGATAGDTCAGDLTAAIVISGTVNTAVPGSYTVTYSVTDGFNPVSTTRTVIVADTTPPVVTLNGANPFVVECHSAFLDPGATANDTCAGSLAVSVSGTVDVNTPGSYTLTYSATDGANSASATRTVLVVDTTPPVLSGCPPATANYQCPGDVPVAPTVTALDACEGAVVVNFTETQSNPGSSCSNVITRTWTATDAHTNTATCTQSTTVQDTTAPSIACPAATSVQCFGDIPAQDASMVTSSDNCGSVTNSFEGDTYATNGCVISVTRTYKSTDACGNMATCAQTITVEDTVPPTLACPPDVLVTIPGNDAGGPVNFPAPSASDNCSVTVTCLPPSGSVFPAGTNVVICTATDACGNSTNCSFSVVVNRAPIALDNGAGARQGRSVTIELPKLLNNDSDADGDPLTVNATSATSTNGGGVTLTSSNVNYTPLPGFIGVDRFSYTVSDGRGGTATATVEIFVADGALPSANQVSLEPVPGGVRLRFAGIPGRAYDIQRTPTLSPATWSTVATLTAPPHGIIEFVDTAGLPTAFYRTTAP